MSNRLYQDPVLKAVADLIDAATNKIRSYYYGDPILINASSLPALILSIDNETAEDDTFEEDVHRMRCVLTLVTDIRKDLGGSKGPNIGVRTSQLYEIMAGRGSDYTLNTDSLLYLVRNNVQLANKVRIDLDSATEVDYNLVRGRRGPEVWSAEAYLSFMVNVYQQR